jgi:hypothetical protein
MSKKQFSFISDFETLFKKATEANKVFFSESNRYIKNLDPSSLRDNRLLENQKDLAVDAFNTFMKLNIQYASNLIDLGLAVTERMNQTSTDKEPERNEQPSTQSQPAFVLSLSGKPGETVRTNFKIDSQKKETIHCTLLHTPYFSQHDANIRKSFGTLFKPQTFDLPSGGSQQILTEIKIPKGTEAGDYLSNVQIQGYEQVYFSILMKVTAPNAAKTRAKSSKTK